MITAVISIFGGYFQLIGQAATQPDTARMLRFFCVILLLNGRWLMERLQRHLEGDKAK